MKLDEACRKFLKYKLVEKGLTLTTIKNYEERFGGVKEI